MWLISKLTWPRGATGTETDPPRGAVPGTRRHEYDRCRVNLQKLAKSNTIAMKYSPGPRKRFACTNLSGKKNNPKLGLRGPPPDQLPPPPEARGDETKHRTIIYGRNHHLNIPPRPRLDLPRPQTKTVNITHLYLIAIFNSWHLSQKIT